MSGLPEVDMNDWEKNTTYANGYDAECPVIVVSKSGLRLIRYDLLYQEQRPNTEYGKIRTSSTCVFLVVLESSAIIIQDRCRIVVAVCYRKVSNLHNVSLHLFL